MLAWSPIQAQAPNLELTLRYNNTLNRYEVYARPDATRANFFWGPSQISVVAPTAVPDAPFLVTSIAAGAWQDNSLIYAPTIDPANDYHGIGSLGAPINFTAGVETLIFHFVIQGGGCYSGLRLFINGSDPDSSQPGMGGGDFSNTVFGIVLPEVPGGYEAYTGNYDNGGTICNEPPMIVQVPVTTPEDTPITICPTIGDPNPGDVLTISICNTPANGTVAVGPGNCVTYTPNLNYNGPDVVCIRVCDQGGLCTDLDVPVTVTPVNDPPVIVQGPVTTPEDTPITICPTLSDPDAGDVLTISSCNTPANGTVVVGPGNCVTYTPNLNFNGSNVVCIQVCDQGGLCTTVDVPVTVTPVNDPPVIVQGPVTTPEDTPITICPTLSDPDAGDVLTISSCNTPANGTVVVGPGNCVTYTPNLNYNGPDVVCIEVCDQGGLCTTVDVPITVTPVNDPPVIVQGPETTPEDTPITICPTISDPDAGDVLTISTCNTPGNGTVVVGPGNCVTYTPNPNYSGPDLVCIEVCDQNNVCTTVDVPITVTPVNDPPVIVQGPVTTPEDTPITICPTISDPDAGDVLTISSCNTPANGTVVVGPGNCVTYTPNLNYTGPDVVCIQVCDQGGLCTTVNVPVTVTPVDAVLQVKVMLQGSLYGTSNGLMRDDLRSGGHLPLTEPYTALGGTRFQQKGGGGGETTTTAVLALNAGTPNAIVDWVFVELRNAVDSAVVLETRSALLQRDGDVVNAADGVSALRFSGLIGQQYFVSVKHRNHAGVMTATAATLTSVGTMVDFIGATNAAIYNKPGAINYDGYEMVNVPVGAGSVKALWAGNTNADGKIKYQGPSSDNSTILAQAISHPGNTSTTYNFNNGFGYYNGDVNMDGKVKYQGTANDPSFIFVNIIGLYPLNSLGLYNYDLMIEQLP